jgi:sugar lactone lactonase YvrE
MHIPSRLIWKTWLTLGLALGLTLVSGCGQQAKTAPPPSSTAPQGQALWTGGGGAGGLYLLGFNPASRAASGTPKPDDFLIGLQDPLFAIRGQSLDVIWGAEGGVYTLGSGGLQLTASLTVPVPTQGYIAGAALDPQGNLWLGSRNFGTGCTFSEFTPAQIQQGGSLQPSQEVTWTGCEFNQASFEFDPQGNLWIVGGFAGNLLARFTPSQLAQGGSQSPSLTVSVTIASGIQGITFDSHGNLWGIVASSPPQSLFELSSAQLAQGGSQQPALLNLSINDWLYSLAFDGQGNLWMGGGNGLYVLSPSQLTPGGSSTPTPGSLAIPLGPFFQLAFDASGNLWVSGSGLFGFTPAQLTPGSTPMPQYSLGGAPQPTALLFDPQGNLWVGTDVSNAVDRYTQSQLVASGGLLPTAILPVPRPFNLTAMAMDPQGGLWIAATGGNNEAALLGYPASELTGSGILNVKPQVEVTLEQAAGQPYFYPSSVAFDSSGHLWVLLRDANSNNLLVSYALGSLPTSGAAFPQSTLTPPSSCSSGGVVDGPLAFDPQGNLWLPCTSFNSSTSTTTLYEYTAAQLAQGGAPTPARTLTLSQGMGSLGSLAFDAQGNLWVNTGIGPTGTTTQLLEYTAAELAQGGSLSPAPAITLNIGHGLGPIAFGPALPPTTRPFPGY